MDSELEQVNKIMMEEISAIRDKYNKQKREIRKKYRELEKKSNPKPKRITIPKSVKDKVWDNTFGSSAGEGKCYVCSDTINSKKFDCGHIIAVSNGGSNDILNLKPICSSCNKSMGTKNMNEFKKQYYKSNIKLINQFGLFSNSNFNNQNQLNKVRSYWKQRKQRDGIDISLNI